MSTISPAVLLSDLELQVKDEELVTQYILLFPEQGEGEKKLRKRKGRW